MKIIRVGEFEEWFNPDHYIAHGYESKPEYIPTRGLFSKPAKTPRWKVWVLLTGNRTLENYTYSGLDAGIAVDKITAELKKTKL
ncbi:hypothetical protein KBA63_00195 [Candidatus Woesebacteria bacterium]|nr:hypothetical protein [Candidatus Woesebacteria bacterium]